MPQGRRTTGNGTKRQCREMVTLMEQDPTTGVRIDGWVYSVKGVTGRYLIIQKKREAEGVPWIEVVTMYISDFVDVIYNNGNNKDVKVVRV